MSDCRQGGRRRLQQVTRTVPIVFAQVGAGFVASLAGPGGDIAKRGVGSKD